METTQGILIAVDDSEASHRAVDYVGTIVGGGKPVRLCLFHALPPIPPSLLEVGGSENPETEAQEEAAIHDAQSRWRTEAEQAAAPVFDRAKTSLREAQVREADIETELATTINGEDVATNILDAARTQGFRTIVVGRTSFSRFQELFRHHVADALIRHSQGLTIWVVE